MSKFLSIAIQAAYAAAEVINAALTNRNTINISPKEQNDFVTTVDFLSEKKIVGVIRQHFPQHSILAEEEGMQEGNEYRWIIDPLDGTINFMCGVPHFAVSIALQHHHQLIAGVVLDVARNELFVAEKGQGAWLGATRLQVSANGVSEIKLLGTGFPAKPHPLFNTHIAIMKAIAHENAGIRRLGSAALDLAYIAAGRLDGYWEFGIKPWDMAAGALLVQEAGGIVTDFNNQPDFFISGHIIAGNHAIHAYLTAVVKSYLI